MIKHRSRRANDLTKHEKMTKKFPEMDKNHRRRANDLSKHKKKRRKNNIMKIMFYKKYYIY